MNFCRLACILAVVGWLPATAFPQEIPEAQARLFLEFASDVSGGDQALLRRVRELVDMPPRTLEGIGFYGMEDAPAPERVIRGIVSLLSNQGHLITVEDKYVYELPGLLIDQGRFGASGGALDVIGYFDGVDWEEGTGAVPWSRFRDWFPEHVDALEQAVRSEGLELLSLRLPLGDTLYFWVALPDLADRWRGRAIYAGRNHLRYNNRFVVISVTRPDWENYWWFMTYALQMPEAFQALPQGLNAAQK